ncbi:MAG: hypothetical protein AAFY63_00535 [Cyanobacteria bacterium J06643_13]
MSMPIVFVMCTEAGGLEQESLLMVESIRRFAGKMKDTPIYSYQVREHTDVSSATRERLKALGVVHQKVVLNTEYPDYPLANKPLLGAYVEANLDAEIIVFLDSDLVFFSEPKEFWLPDGCDLGIRPEHEKMIGSEGEADANDSYWQHLYRLAGVTEPQYVTTTVDRRKIKAFWNSGVVAVKRSAGVFTAWLETFSKLVEPGISVNKANFYYEQSSLSATICAQDIKIWNFSPGYNYPIHSHNNLIETERKHSFKEIVCIHDHFYRSREWYRERTWVKTLKRLYDFDRNNEAYRWFYQYLQQTHPRPNLVQSFLEQVLFLPVVRKLMPYRR